MQKENDRALYKGYLKKLKHLELIISFLCILGIFICLYSIQVEIYKSRDKNYVAYCDINDWISCSRVFNSKYFSIFFFSNLHFIVVSFLNRYGKGFGLMPENSIFDQHNSIYGLVFFIIQLLLCK